MRRLAISLGAVALLGCQLVTGAFSVGDEGLSGDGGSSDAHVSGADSGADSRPDAAGESATFTMTQSCLTGHAPSASLLVTLSGSAVMVARTNSTDGFDPTYSGTMSADCSSVSGT